MYLLYKGSLGVCVIVCFDDTIDLSDDDFFKGKKERPVS